MLNKELQELHNVKKYAMDASALATALESEQLGASRAVHQNQQLKNQIDEMHDAFVLLVSLLKQILLFKFKLVISMI